MTSTSSGPLPPAVASMTLLVGAVIVHDVEAGRVLLLQRGPEAKFAPGKWDLPVGKSEPGEAVTDTAVRELREETGLVVTSDDLHVAHLVHGRRGVETPNGFLTVIFATRNWSGEAVNVEPHKHAEVRWWDVDVLPENAVPSMRKAVTRYFAGGPQISLMGWP